MGNLWVVRTWQNLTATDTGHSFKGSSQRLLGEAAYDTEAAALAAYRAQKSILKYAAGGVGVYVGYPIEAEDYTPAVIPDKYCDECGEGIHLAPACEDGTTPDVGYTDLLGGDFCSKACFRNRFSEERSEDDNYDEEPYDDGGY